MEQAEHTCTVRVHVAVSLPLQLFPVGYESHEAWIVVEATLHASETQTVLVVPNHPSFLGLGFITLHGAWVLSTCRGRR